MARHLSQLRRIPVTELKGVGPSAAAALDRAFGITTVADLLTHYPRRWVDRTKQASIAELTVGEEGTVLGRVAEVTTRRTRTRKLLVTATVTDGSGWLQVSFFNQRWRASQLKAGTECVLSGKVERYGRTLRMTNPFVDLIGDASDRIVAVYPQSQKERLTSRDLDRWMAEALRRAGEFADPVPPELLRRHSLIDRTTAFSQIHRPDSLQARSAARRRLVFDELFRLQVSLVARKRLLERDTVGVVHRVGTGPAGGPDLLADFLERLPFGLTAAQARVLDELTADLARAVPMHRLLQGDVGSGKTVVAVAALLVAVQNGHQGALMAPTAVLAEQHYASVRDLVGSFTLGDGGRSLFGERPLAVELLTNRTTPTERRRLLAGLADGTVDVLIGTHALIQEAVTFRSLSVAVIDEQHRFGVEQRAALRERSAAAAAPDVLVMTATPIPRTAAMTVYGDLDVSVLDELPAGRQPIATALVRRGAAALTDATSGPDEEEMWTHVRAEVAAGRQAYVVCPLVEGSEKLDATSAEQTHAELSAGALAGLRLGLLHGRLSARDKEQVMGLFRDGEVDVLVATTVIEVGVDVPNATVMVVLDADRFGIAQLHQLRGRVGRGSAASVCYLVSASDSDDARARLDALVNSTDGFELAEVDLDLRGEGTLLGERQKGLNDLKLASLRHDRAWVEQAREAAIEVVGDDPSLRAHPLLAEEVGAFLGDAADYLMKS